MIYKFFFLLLLSSLFATKHMAILDINSEEGISKSEARILTETLTNEMIELSDYIIVERVNIEKILKEQKFQHSGCTDSECAVQIGQLINADMTIIGTASKFGKTYTIDSRIINVESGEALFSACREKLLVLAERHFWVIAESHFWTLAERHFLLHAERYFWYPSNASPCIANASIARN